jgi:hypothetical protein
VKNYFTGKNILREFFRVDLSQYKSFNLDIDFANVINRMLSVLNLKLSHTDKNLQI